jgi:hypothetical protein
LAIRTRCRATSACSLARSSGSAGSAAEVVAGGEAFASALAADDTAPADRFFLAVFPMQRRVVAKGGQCHTIAMRLPPRFYPQIL